MSVWKGWNIFLSLRNAPMAGEKTEREKASREEKLDNQIGWRVWTQLQKPRVTTSYSRLPFSHFLISSSFLLLPKYLFPSSYFLLPAPLLAAHLHWLDRTVWMIVFSEAEKEGDDLIMPPVSFMKINHFPSPGITYQQTLRCNLGVRSFF
jgi:hypothetical protein